MYFKGMKDVDAIVAMPPKRWLCCEYFMRRGLVLVFRGEFCKIFYQSLVLRSMYVVGFHRFSLNLNKTRF